MCVRERGRERGREREGERKTEERRAEDRREEKRIGEEKRGQITVWNPKEKERERE